MNTYSEKVTKGESGRRLDVHIHSILQSKVSKNISRTFTDTIIDDIVLVNERKEKKGYHLREGDTLSVDLDKVRGRIEEGMRENELISSKGELDIVEEGTDYLVINKRAGVPVHPGKGNRENTVANIVKGYLESKGEYDKEVLRGGIVHRMDKGVSGLLIIAKNRKTQIFLQKQFENHTVLKIYKAELDQEVGGKEKDIKAEIRSLVENGVGDEWIKVEGYIARDHRNRIKMKLSDKGKHAVMYYLPIGGHSILIKLETGRMHQIRASLESLGFSIKGDALYGSSESSKGLGLTSIYLSCEISEGDLRKWSLV